MRTCRVSSKLLRDNAVRNASIFILLLLALTACTGSPKTIQAPVKVDVVKTADGYQLLRDGQPYQIKGAGLEYGDISSLAAHGGNSIRTWTTENDVESAQQVLDKALANGVTVALCLPMGAEHWGFDYNDKRAVKAQYDRLRAEVLKYRDHPALLVWIIGNELNFDYTNPKVFDAVNDVAKMVHELDPNHPTTTTIAGVHGRERELSDIAERAPEIDFISFQVYGELAILPDVIRATGFDKPFLVTEWGAFGHWEVPQTTWGAPIEMTSSEKANFYLDGYKNKLEPLAGQLIGSYVFLWGQKQERTPTWFGLFTRAGEETETVDVMHYIWNGSWPSNRAPQVKSFMLDGKSAKQSVTLYSGQRYTAALDIADPDNDPLTYRWEVKPESDARHAGGANEETITSLEGVVADAAGYKADITAPAPGNYRLYVYAYDGEGHAAHANIPFQVISGVSKLIAGETIAVAYSGFRDGQHPDRGDGAVNPSVDEILEDLRILVAHDLKLVRLYDSGENSRTTLELIRKHDLPIKVLLGVWLKAEVSNHLGCAWLEEPIPDEELARNIALNSEEVGRGIVLANEYPDLVVAVSVGNEALVDWNDHMVSVASVINYVRQVKTAIAQPVTVADNYAWWASDGASLAAEVDFLGVHTYPQWEGKTIDEALDYSIENITAVRAALPDKPIAVLEAGWASVASEFGDRANEQDQSRYFTELKQWAIETNTTIFFFEAFDEPWKGDSADPLGAEKHWGMFNVDRTPKQVLTSNGK